MDCRTWTGPCGQCWETVIREDERTVTAALGNGVPVPEFSAARP